MVPWSTLVSGYPTLVSLVPGLPGTPTWSTLACGHLTLLSLVPGLPGTPTWSTLAMRVPYPRLTGPWSLPGTPTWSTLAGGHPYPGLTGPWSPWYPPNLVYPGLRVLAFGEFSLKTWADQSCWLSVYKCSRILDH
ncbi:hypothetical protein MTO96_004007 [Rhipicephalus appendiculatus]